MNRLLGLIGYPLSHSFSASYFNEKFQNEKISNLSYKTFEIISLNELIPLINSHPGLFGLNVTIPYKESVIPLLNELSSLAGIVGAVNTILIDRTNDKIRLVGHNTDIQGFNDSLTSFISVNKPDALVLGSGGASKSVRYVLEMLGIRYQIVSRSGVKNTISYNSLDERVIRNHQLIINTSPLGMFPDINSMPRIPYDGLTPEHYLFDLIYNPTQTAFMQEGLKHGCKVKNGYDMLVIQAEAAWKIWNRKL